MAKEQGVLLLQRSVVPIGTEDGIYSSRMSKITAFIKDGVHRSIGTMADARWRT